MEIRLWSGPGVLDMKHSIPKLVGQRRLNGVRLSLRLRFLLDLNCSLNLLLESLVNFFGGDREGEEPHAYCIGHGVGDGGGWTVIGEFADSLSLIRRDPARRTNQHSFEFWNIGHGG